MGLRGPKTLPDNVHMMRGNPSKKNFSIQDGVQPEVVIPKCPPHLSDEAKKEYKRVSVELKELGLISKIDRSSLAGYCSAWAEVVHCEVKIAELNAKDPKGEAGLIGYTPNGFQQMSVWVQIRNRAYERMIKFSAEFGMSPSTRARVTASDNQMTLPGLDKLTLPTTNGWHQI